MNLVAIRGGGGIDIDHVVSLKLLVLQIMQKFCVWRRGGAHEKRHAFRMPF
jgi:hypothetical protein